MFVLVFIAHHCHCPFDITYDSRGQLLVQLTAFLSCHHCLLCLLCCHTWRINWLIEIDWLIFCWIELACQVCMGTKQNNIFSWYVDNSICVLYIFYSAFLNWYIYLSLTFAVVFEKVMFTVFLQHVTADTHFTVIPRRVEGWVDLDGWLHIQTVYLSTSSHPSM